jgi:adenylyltransferase/sulfurtransferase
MRFAPIGREGQERIESATVLLVGCGALGGVLAQTLARAGVGRLRIVDRDVVEESNLARQVLFEERHARAGTPKAEAAAETLARIGGPTRIEALAEHLDASNVEELGRGVDLVLDGTDNLSTRYLVNDWCVENTRPWVYGGVVGSAGLVMAVLPGSGPCLRCLFPSPPPPGTLATCDTAGVILPAVGAIASLQAGLALRVLASREPLVAHLIEIDVWSGEARTLQVERAEDCPCCGRGEREFLHAPHSEAAQVLCGRHAVQVRGRGPLSDFDRVTEALARSTSDLERKASLVRFQVEGLRVTLFRDGRALVEGTEEVERALALYDRYVGT